MSDAAPGSAQHDAVERFRELLRLPTVSYFDDSSTDWTAFDAFAERSPVLYPALHAATDLERIAGRSLLYRWRGREEGAPTVLMAHYDVVAAAAEGWTHPPFAAHLDDAGVLYARGAIDDKGALVAILEACERLALAGFQPEQDVYLSFGFDEEVAGVAAGEVVAALHGRGIRPRLVLDEGGAVVEPGLIAGIDRSLAVIGVTEKGITTVELAVEQPGGHASTPPRRTAPGRLARAIMRLEARPFPLRMNAAVRAFVRALAPFSTGPRRALFAGVDRTAPLVGAIFSRLGDETRAMVRTTAAVTQLRGSDGGNVLAERASALVNIRVAVGSSVDEAVRHVRRAIGDPGVSVTVLHGSEPSPVSPSEGEAWDRLVSALAEAYPGVAPIPYTMLGASDARHFTAISEHVYRFTPFELHAAERATLHARNEHIRVSTWLTGIDFYESLLRSS